MEYGLALANRATSALANVGEAIAQTSVVAEDGAARSAVMQGASSTLNRDMSSVSAIVEDDVSASTAELATHVQEMDATAHELSAQAASLMDLVSVFEAAASPTAAEKPDQPAVSPTDATNVLWLAH